jgi:PAS domain S-box-containing protein
MLSRKLKCTPLLGRKPDRFPEIRPVWYNARMRKLRVRGVHNLSAQMILSFVGLVVLTAIAAGVPAVLLIRRELERQAWSQVEQGTLAAQAFLDSRSTELADIALLTAQRPTLHQLVAGGNLAGLQAYLRTLQTGSGLDAVVLCDADRRPLDWAGDPVAGGVCAQIGAEHPGLYVVRGAEGPHVWLLAAYPLTASNSQEATALVGKRLDDGSVEQMRAEIGLEHTLLVDGEPAATSLAARRTASQPAAGREGRGRLRVNGHSYYTTRVPLEAAGLELEQLLDVTEIVRTQRELIWTLVGILVGISLIAFILGVVLAQRIGRPLARLSQAAGSMAADDLDNALTVETTIQEVTLLAHALERARTNLQRSVAELRREKAWTDHLLQSIVEGIMTLDRQGRITFFSDGAERITGWSRDEVLGLGCDQVLQPVETSRPFSQLIPAPGRRTKVPVELRDGRQAILAITGARLMPPEGAEARVALVFRDVSEEEAVHRLLGHFLANVAHEFRTPLSALAASVELLVDQAPDLSPAEMHELLGPLHLGVLGLQTLIDNLLESASIEAGQFRVQPKPTALDEIIVEAIATMQPLLDRRGQRLVVELPAAIPVVYADPRRTSQVLINLLSNASKYGPDDAEIELGASVDDGWARVDVADAGPGVPPEHRSDLFRPFRLPGSDDDRAQLGAGLGLSVVKAVIEAHNGQVGIGDRPGGGAVFWFTLPIAGRHERMELPA